MAKAEERDVSVEELQEKIRQLGEAVREKTTRTASGYGLTVGAIALGLLAAGFLLGRKRRKR